MSLSRPDTATTSGKVSEKHADADAKAAPSPAGAKDTHSPATVAPPKSIARRALFWRKKAVADDIVLGEKSSQSTEDVGTAVPHVEDIKEVAFTELLR
ncbi:hypothetical protein EW145_g4744 [Phellinidium pouzarii]|uniref:Uncharacterized protein n=1 Tax=Phellinidium pouzarii TaxID=167371 RepID=A0A4S4L2L5_9AGAM|nr:hypothetical protein EW145_g4744 [Phellinidium pouzarii]